MVAVRGLGPLVAVPGKPRLEADRLPPAEFEPGEVKVDGVLCGRELLAELDAGLQERRVGRFDGLQLAGGEPEHPVEAAHPDHAAPVHEQGLYLADLGQPGDLEGRPRGGSEGDLADSRPMTGILGPSAKGLPKATHMSPTRIAGSRWRRPPSSRGNRREGLVDPAGGRVDLDTLAGEDGYGVVEAADADAPRVGKPALGPEPFGRRRPVRRLADEKAAAGPRPDPDVALLVLDQGLGYVRQVDEGGRRRRLAGGHVEPDDLVGVGDKEAVRAQGAAQEEDVRPRREDLGRRVALEADDLLESGGVDRPVRPAVEVGVVAGELRYLGEPRRVAGADRQAEYALLGRDKDDRLVRGDAVA